jgi:hypothetical protein
MMMPTITVFVLTEWLLKYNQDRSEVPTDFWTDLPKDPYINGSSYTLITIPLGEYSRWLKYCPAKQPAQEKVLLKG